LFDSEKDLKRFLPLGLNDDYDQFMKFSPRDLILVGGRRGAGKSIACCNIAHNVYEQGKSSLYFTIEMDARSILQRMCALGARIPISRLATRNLTTVEWDRVANWWAGRFQDGVELLSEFKDTRDFDAFHTKLQTKPLNDGQMDVVYDPTLTLSRIRQELESKVSQTDYGVIVVDYLNQVKRSNAPSRSGQYDWTEQIEVSKTLKSIAQEYEVPVFAPYQTDSTGEARFAKGILDAADAAFTLETWSPEDEAMTFNCTKMRSAKMEGFTSVMDWETLKIGPQSTMNPKEKEEIKDSLSTGEDIHDAI
jgi:replicative DNA helicase